MYVKRNQLIASSPDPTHAQLATADRIKTHPFLIASFIAGNFNSEKLVLHIEPPFCNIIASKRAIGGEPLFGPNLPFKVMVSQIFVSLSL
jgi:hypothetical protein